MIHISAPLLREQVPKTFPCTKTTGRAECVQCYHEKLTGDMRQRLFTSDISVNVFYGFWQANARTNKGQDPGPPPPIGPYQDRLGPNRGLKLVTWRNEDNFECKGTKAAHQQAVQATLREASQDPVAKERGDSKEADRRKQSAVNQNRKAMKFSDDEESSKDKGTAARRESSKTTKVKKDFFEKTGKPKEKQESQAKARTPKGSSRSISPSLDRRKGPPNSKVDLSSSDSSQGKKEGKEPPPTGHQARRPFSRQRRSKSPAIYEDMEMEKKQAFQKSRPQVPG